MLDLRLESGNELRHHHHAGTHSVLRIHLLDGAEMSANTLDLNDQKGFLEFVREVEIIAGIVYAEYPMEDDRCKRALKMLELLAEVRRDIDLQNRRKEMDDWASENRLRGIE